MQTRADKFSRFERAGAARGMLPLLVTGIAVVVFATAGFARMAGWSPNATEGPGAIDAVDRPEPESTASEVRTRPKCPECGMIVSIREIVGRDDDSGPGAAGGATAGNRDETRVEAAGRYEITVRMAGGSSRVIDLANPARWRTGERLIVIAGTNPSEQ